MCGGPDWNDYRATGRSEKGSPNASWIKLGEGCQRGLTSHALTRVSTNRPEHHPKSAAEHCLGQTPERQMRK